MNRHLVIGLSLGALTALFVWGATPVDTMRNLPPTAAETNRSVSLSGKADQDDGFGGIFFIIADDGRTVDETNVFRHAVRTNLLFVRFTPAFKNFAVAKFRATNWFITFADPIDAINVNELDVQTRLEVFGDVAKTNEIGGAGTRFSNWVALSWTTNKLTDDGQQLLRNGLPIGGFTTNQFNVIIVTNVQVVEILEVKNSFFTNVTVYEIITIATNITIDQYITLKQNSTLIFTNNTFVSTNQFIFVNELGQVIGIDLNAGDGISITSKTNISANLEAGTGITLATNAGVISITSSTSDIWDNTGGVIAPAGGQDTNVLRFTSGLADNATNVAVVIDSTSTWSTDGAKLLSIQNNGTNVAYFTEAGGLALGRTDILGPFSDGISIYSLRNLENGNPGNTAYFESISDNSFTADALITLATSAPSATDASSTITVAATDADASPYWDVSSQTANLAVNRIRYTSSAGQIRVNFLPEVADGASATAYLLDSQNALSTAGAKILKLSTAGSEKFSVAGSGATTIAQSAAEPAAPAAGYFTLFGIDGGSKDVAKVRFPTGSAQTIAMINPTDKYIPYRSDTNTLSDSTMFHEDGITKVDANVGAVLTVGDTTFIDVRKGSQTNAVSGALTFAHATNGIHGVDMTHVRWLFNGSGSDQTLTIPSGWRTNVYSAVPPALTNGTITRMVIACGGATASAAAQTNCYVSFEYYK